MKVEFEEVVPQKIPREENKKVDGLARITSVITQRVDKDVVTRIKLVAQVD